jgi:hypothetical protein
VASQQGPGSEPRRTELSAKYDPGQFVFDYFNESQLSDIAQGLGINLATSRLVSHESTTGANGKFALVVEFGASHDRKAGEAANYQGMLQTATIVEVLVRLQQARRLAAHTVARGTLSAIGGAWHTAAETGWLIAESMWHVGVDPLVLRLAGGSCSSDSLDEPPDVVIEVPAVSNELTPSGRVRLRRDQCIKASVFAQVEKWGRDQTHVVGIAHAVFARQGDHRFEWQGVQYSYGSNGSGGFD